MYRYAVGYYVGNTKAMVFHNSEHPFIKLAMTEVLAKINKVSQNEIEIVGFLRAY